MKEGGALGDLGKGMGLDEGRWWEWLYTKALYHHSDALVKLHVHHMQAPWQPLGPLYSITYIYSFTDIACGTIVHENGMCG